MGPALFGEFALLLSMERLLGLAAGLGGLSVFGRFIPEYRLQGQWHKIRALFVQVFLVRLLMAVAMAAGFVVAIPRILEGVSAQVVLWGALALLASIASVTPYQLFYGLNRLSYWLSKEALLHFVLITLLALFAGWDSLGEAVMSLAVTHLLFLTLGLAWSRPFFVFSRAGLREVSLFEHLGFGMAFFVTNLIYLAIWRGGEILIPLFRGDSAEIAYLNVANSIVLAFSALIAQVSTILLPSLSSFQAAGSDAKRDLYLGYTLKYLVIGSVTILLIVMASAERGVGVILGEDFAPVATNLKILASGLLPVAVIQMGLTMATLNKRPGEALAVAGTALPVFAVTASLLIPRAGSSGASIAISISLAAAAVSASWRFSMGAILRSAHVGPVLAAGLAGALAALAPPVQKLGLTWIVPIAFMSALFGLKILNWKELRQIAGKLQGSREQEVR